MFTRSQPFLRHAEVVTAIIGGIIGLVLDSSFITFNSDMEKVWSIALDPYKFPPMVQMNLKYFISLLVVIRTFTLHITIAMYVVMLWPAIVQGEKPSLIIPWLIVGTTRLCVDLMATIAGLYVASAYGLLNTLWLEFLLAQIFEHGPFFYIWYTLVKYLLFLVELREIILKRWEEELYRIKTSPKYRKRLRHDKEDRCEANKEEKTDSISQSTVFTIVEHISKRRTNFTARSLDTLLEIIDKNKNEGETCKSIERTVKNDKLQSRAMRKLQLSNEDIEEARRSKSNRSSVLSNQIVPNDAKLENDRASERTSTTDYIFLNETITDGEMLPQELSGVHSEMELHSFDLSNKSAKILRGSEDDHG